MSRDKDFNDLCIGNVTIITSNNLVLTGRVIRDKDDSNRHGIGHTQPAVQPGKNDDDFNFIRLTLTAPVLFIPATGGPAVEQPFYVVGDTILINVNQIVTIGPSHI